MVKQLEKLHRRSVGRIGGEHVSPREQPGDLRTDRASAGRHARRCGRAAKAAKAAFPEWRSTPVLSRAQYMYRFKALLEDRFEELSKQSSKENGKTRDEARGEVRRGIESVDFAVSVPSIMRGYKVEDISSGIDETAERQPIGVFAAITPFNFPNMVPLWFLPTAITCGNTYIVKPSPQTPLSMDILYEMLDELDLPEGVVNLVHGGKEASIAVMEHPDIVGVSFVGSTPVAKIVYETCAKARQARAGTGRREELHRRHARRRYAGERRQHHGVGVRLRRSALPRRVGGRGGRRCLRAAQSRTGQARGDACASATGWKKRRRWARSFRRRRVSASRR